MRGFPRRSGPGHGVRRPEIVPSVSGCPNEVVRLCDPARLGYLIGVPKESRTTPDVRSDSSPVSCASSSAGLILIVGVALVVAIIATESIAALAIAALDGGGTVLVLAAASLAGGWMVPLVGFGRAPWHERLIIGAGLGTGGLSLLTLGLGSAGWLNRPVALALAGILAVVGIARLALDVRRQQAGPRPNTQQSGPFNWLWLMVCPFLAIAILAACLPPGMLWGRPGTEEAYGYDVLEYHLAVPKAFFEQGHIGFLANNTYSNFPLNSEMLSLLMMALRGDAVEAAFMAQMVNVFFAGLFAAAAWLAGKAFSERSGLVAGVLALTAPWTAYLAGIAYVEVGMLALGMCAFAVVLRTDVRTEGAGRRGLAAGLLAGLSAGFKYTAIPLVAIPAALLVIFCRRSPRKRLLALASFAVGLLISFSPWMLRNLMNTRNPVFPMAYSVFGAKPGLWDAELEARWQKAHGRQGIAEADKPLFVRLVGRTIGDYRMGGILVALAVAGAVVARDRWTVALLLILVLQAVFWMFATHQYARFAVVMLLPLVILAGRAFEAGFGGRQWLLGFLIVGAAWNLYRLGGLYYDHTRVKTVAGSVRLDAYGHTNWFVSGQWPSTRILKPVNARPPGTVVMLVGEARSYYVTSPCDCATVFNRHPLADAARDQPDPQAIMHWLRGRGIRYILVDWMEMERLRDTYGFDPEIDAVLFEKLEPAGLRLVEAFFVPETERVYATLYEVPPR